MVPSATGYHLAILAITCILAIFFFPLVSGPYPVTHGPVSDGEGIRCSRLLALILSLLALAGFTAIARLCASIASKRSELSHSVPLPFVTNQISVLRC
jgi:hypothetical protein